MYTNTCRSDSSFGGIYVDNVVRYSNHVQSTVDLNPCCYWLQLLFQLLPPASTLYCCGLQLQHNYIVFTTSVMVQVQTPLNHEVVVSHTVQVALGDWLHLLLPKKLLESSGFCRIPREFLETHQHHSSSIPSWASSSACHSAWTNVQDQEVVDA